MCSLSNIITGLRKKMKVVRNIKELREQISLLKKNGKTIGFVPTMGALHDGHLSLVDLAKKHSDNVVVSIFVNPAQFAPHEDFDKYPRHEEDDIRKLSSKDPSIIYLPTKNEMYSENFDLKISTGNIGKELEGIARPHFFDGVALVVTKLFMQVQPDIAVFGEKDFQQLHVIKKLVKQLDMPIKVIGAPIIREKSGLAMSSRNAYLSEDQSQISSKIYLVLKNIKEKIENNSSIDSAIKWGKEELLNQGLTKVDYMELRDSQTLEKVTIINSPVRLLTAVYSGQTRLIDNIEVLPSIYS